MTIARYDEIYMGTDRASKDMIVIGIVQDNGHNCAYAYRMSEGGIPRNQFADGDIGKVKSFCKLVASKHIFEFGQQERACVQGNLPFASQVKETARRAMPQQT